MSDKHPYRYGIGSGSTRDRRPITIANTRNSTVPRIQAIDAHPWVSTSILLSLKKVQSLNR